VKSGERGGRPRKAEVRFRLRVTRGEDIALGPGKIALLEAIARTGSITAAAKELGMSYRRAWLLVDTMNRSFRTAVVEAGAGGSHGGGAALTALGQEVVARYRRIEATAAQAAAADIRGIEGLLRK
jgi:molybdate transport system regulatory protein